GPDRAARLARQFLGRRARSLPPRGGKDRANTKEDQMNERVVIAPVRKTVHVKAPIAHAFEVFTSGLTRWWPRDHGLGKKLILNGKVGAEAGGGRAEASGDGPEPTAGTIHVWAPPHRLVLLWQVNAQWKPDAAMKSEVDVRFTADGPDATNVELVHHK